MRMRADFEDAASSNFLEEQERLSRASPIKNEGIEGEAEAEAVMGGAADEIEDYLSKFSDVIQHYVIKSDKIQEFNYPIFHLNIETIQKILNDVIEQLPPKKEVLISLEAGYLLHHSVTGELRYFFGSWNTILGGAKVTLNSSYMETVKKAVKYYSSLDLKSYLNNNWVPSPWQFVHAVNAHCIIQFFRPETKKKQIS